MNEETPKSSVQLALESRVFGQDARTVADKLAANPAASFLFTGAGGSGKTTMGHAIAEVTETNEVLLRMNDYNADHYVYQLIGIPPGHSGYNGITRLDPIIVSPRSTVIFDEIDKAAPAVLRIFNEILLTRKVMLSTGREVDFSQAAIVATTANPEKTPDDVMKMLRQAGLLQKEWVYEPAALERWEKGEMFSVSLEFGPLSDDSLKAIARREFNGLSGRLKKIGVPEGLAVSDQAVDEVVSRSPHRERDGGRAVVHAIGHDIAYSLRRSFESLAGQQRIDLDYRDGNFLFSGKPAAPFL